jgi:hypothetical protein
MRPSTSLGKGGVSGKTSPIPSEVEGRTTIHSISPEHAAADVV